MLEKMLDYASRGTGEMVSLMVIALLAVGVAFIGFKSFIDSFRSKEDDPETAEKKRIAKEALRAEAYLWQEEVETLKEQYGGKIPPEVLQRKLALFNQRHKVMQ